MPAELSIFDGDYKKENLSSNPTRSTILLVFS
jgi:hypothetical protein